MSNESLLTDAINKAQANPDDVEAQIAAAWACDSHGDEGDAIGYYDAAWALGIPDDKRKRFMVGYGSTLRNMGRYADSIAILQAAIQDYPGYAPHSAFLALSLHADGSHDQAMASALHALLEAGAENLDGYERSLAYYRGILAETPPE